MTVYNDCNHVAYTGGGGVSLVHLLPPQQVQQLHATCTDGFNLAQRRAAPKLPLIILVQAGPERAADKPGTAAEESRKRMKSHLRPSVSPAEEHLRTKCSCTRCSKDRALAMRTSGSEPCEPSLGASV